MEATLGCSHAHGFPSVAILTASDMDRLAGRVLSVASCSPTGAAAPALLHDGHGRPFLNWAGAPDVSLSSVRGIAVAALCREARVGVDVEIAARVSDYHVEAAGLPEEIARFSTWRRSLGRRAFPAFWCAKEAAFKASSCASACTLLRHVKVRLDGPDHFMFDSPVGCGNGRLWHGPRLTLALAVRSDQRSRTTMEVT